MPKNTAMLAHVILLQNKSKNTKKWHGFYEPIYISIKIIKGMQTKYQQLEKVFEKTTVVITTILGNSTIFILATLFVVFWLANINYATQSLNNIIRVYIYSVSFLTLFIIQKTFNHFLAPFY